MTCAVVSSAANDPAICVLFAPCRAVSENPHRLADGSLIVTVTLYFSPAFHVVWGSVILTFPLPALAAAAWHPTQVDSPGAPLTPAGAPPLTANACGAAASIKRQTVLMP
jgi:hypothetical protein